MDGRNGADAQNGVGDAHATPSTPSSTPSFALSFDSLAQADSTFVSGGERASNAYANYAPSNSDGLTGGLADGGAYNAGGSAGNPAQDGISAAYANPAQNGVGEPHAYPSAPAGEGVSAAYTDNPAQDGVNGAPAANEQADPNAAPQITGISRKEIRKSYQAQVAKIFFKDMVLVILAAMALTLVLKTFVFQPFGVPSSSMEDTLKPDDRILVSKVSLVRGIQRGDVVVFRDTKGWLRGEAISPKEPDSALNSVLKFIGIAPEDNNEYLVKRVIGIPGDKVSSKGGSAPLEVNGHEIFNEPYLKPGAAHSSFSFEVTVPEGQIWVMGDNRPVSADSRLNTDKPGKGFVDEKDVVGIVFMRVWPQSRFGFLEDERKVFAEVPDPDASEGGDK